MNSWSNISISSKDLEIIKIDQFEAKLGKLSNNVRKIRELITRLEVCHFKYKQHIKKIKESIINFKPVVAPDKIGINHIQHGENAWKKDSSGKSLPGQQYVWGINDWLGDIHSEEIPDKYNNELGVKIKKWLGDKNDNKIRLVRLLLARLTWDWKLLEELQHGGEHKELEFQICRIDICHYAFPSNLDSLLIGIGEMRSIEDFEGCGSFDNSIKKFVEKKLDALIDLSKSLYEKNGSSQRNQIRIWLLACLIKTLKEQVELSEPLIEL